MAKETELCQPYMTRPRFYVEYRATECCVMFDKYAIGKFPGSYLEWGETNPVVATFDMANHEQAEKMAQAMCDWYDKYVVDTEGCIYQELFNAGFSEAAGGNNFIPYL